MSDALLVACSDNDYSTVSVLLKFGANPNGFCKPLLFAVKHSNLEIIKLLVSEGARIHGFKSELIESDPFVSAIISNRLDVVEYLVSAGANVHIRGEHALFEAIINHNFSIAEFLMSNGSDIHYGIDVMLVEAIHCEDARAVEFILSHGAFSKKWYTDYVYDDIASEKAIYGLMLKYEVYPPDELNHALSVASSIDSVSTVMLMINRGADVAFNDYQAIRVSANSGSIEVLKFYESLNVVDFGFNDNIIIRGAIQYSQVNIALYLISKGYCKPELVESFSEAIRDKLAESEIRQLTHSPT